MHFFNYYTAAALYCFWLKPKWG